MKNILLEVLVTMAIVYLVYYIVQLLAK